MLVQSNTPREHGAMDLVHLYFGHDGRIGRMAYWLASLSLIVPVVTAEMIARSSQDAVALTIVLVVSLVVLGSNLMISIKRCHDRDRSGWFVLISLIPVIGSLWLLIELGFLRGTRGPNRFGDDPSDSSRIAPAMSG